MQSGLAQEMERYLRRYFAAHAPDVPPAGLHERMVKLMELPLFALTLEITGGNQCRAAEILGINRNTLRRRLEALGLTERAEAPKPRRAARSRAG